LFKGEIRMTSYGQIKNDAQSAGSSSDDTEIRKLASAVYELTRKVKKLEDEVSRLKNQIR
jgi:predicted  nucleic acid-binding Zn-ribbon protein